MIVYPTAFDRSCFNPVVCLATPLTGKLGRGTGLVTIGPTYTHTQHATSTSSTRSVICHNWNKYNAVLDLIWKHRRNKSSLCIINTELYTQINTELDAQINRAQIKYNGIKIKSIPTVFRGFELFCVNSE